MAITLNLQHTVQTKTEPSQRAMRAATMFGLSLDGTHEHVVLPSLELPLLPGQLVFVTGVSGGGKSTLLRLIHSAIDSMPPTSTEQVPGVVWSDRLPELADTALVDALAMPEVDHALPPADFDTVCRWLSRAGLNDAAVMLRRPSELSQGQQHRLRLAQALAVAERRPEPWSVLLADEFGSTLDRTTASVIAGSVRRWVRRSRVCFVAATAHEDLLEPLDPDVLVEVEPAGRCAVHHRSS